MDKDERLLKIVLRYREELQRKIKERQYEMQHDNNDHYLMQSGYNSPRLAA